MSPNLFDCVCVCVYKVLVNSSKESHLENSGDFEETIWS